MQRFFAISFFLTAAAILTPLNAGGFFQQVIVDNEHIHTYQGHLGLWSRYNGERLESLADQFGTEVDEIRRLNPGRIQRNQHIFIPYGENVYHQLLREEKGRRIYQLEPEKMVWPVENPHYSSRFGPRNREMHSGLDMACPPNTIILAAEAGVVRASGWFGGLGKAIAIDHPDGLVTWYAHNNTLLLTPGDEVVKGQIIAFSGNTGRSTGPHLHFEVRYMEIALNPEDFIQFGLVRPDFVQREMLLDGEQIAQKSSDRGGELTVAERHEQLLRQSLSNTSRGGR